LLSSSIVVAFSIAAVSTEPHLRTERLLLRRWQPRDREPLAAMNADAEVMEHFPATLSAEQSAAAIARFEACFEAHRYGLWALELPGQAPLIGFAGLAPVDPVDLPVAFAPAVEVGWRLARAFWGHGYATEAAAQAIAFGFQRRGLRELVSFTAARNLRSRRVMERLGMRRDPSEDFDHPWLGEHDELRRHVLYRLDVARWRSATIARERGS
jgi:RimJ/RimL family protein N-acetyltransferase